jgi:histidyl-tRNA synthetase
MALPTQPYKGARDFYPEEMRLEKYIFAKWREACERFGYEEYDAPILEPTELYLSKGNEEIIKEQTYSFTDRGGRDVTLRTEMTPTVSRMVAARRQELAYPLRMYSIPQCWRYERMQRGRGREFYQLNVDLFGVPSLSADQEMIQVSDAIMQSFGAKRTMYNIKINSRMLVDVVMGKYLGLDGDRASAMIRLVDRMHKMERAEFRQQVEALFTPEQRENRYVDGLFAFLASKSIANLPPALAQEPSVLTLNVLIESLTELGITNVEFDPTLMRGFDYYTDIVFEVFDTDPENKRAMFGGGRYDGLVAAFGVEPVPTVGFAMGDITLGNFLQTHELLPALRTETDIYIVLIGDVFDKAQRAISELREAGVNVAVDTSGRPTDKQIKAAVKKGVAYAMFIGEKEVAEEQFELKNLLAGKSERHSVARIISIVKDYRA